MRFTYQTGAQPLAGFTIQRGIHRGGFGEVYFAHSDGGKEVALKLLHQQDCDVEVRGVSQCLNLKHPNLVNLFDIKTDSEGDHWVVMEYVAGSSLEDVLASFPDGLPLTEVRDWLSGLVAGVSHLHDRGIVHRDLKPANVYRENGVVKIGDVGLSKRLNSEGGRQHTQSVGTVYYMAPEVAKGQYGPEVDVYSLGVMLYELISGKLPFTGETTAEILMKHLTVQPDLSPIPRRLRPMLARALEKDPRKRTPSARQLEHEFLRANGMSESRKIPESAFIPHVDARNVNGHAAKSDSPRIRIPITAATTEPPRNGQPTGKPRIPLIGILVIGAFVLFIPKAFWVARHGARLVWFIPSIILAVCLFVVTHRPFRRTRPVLRRPLEPIPVSTPVVSEIFAERSTSRMNVPPIERPMRSMIERLPELSHSIGMAGLVASLLSAGVYLSLEAFNRSSVMPSAEHAALFTAVSVIGSWLMLVGHSWTVNPSWTKRQRWYARVGFGVMIGTCAFALDQFLLVHIPKAAFVAKPVFSSLGVHRLNFASVDPTCLGFAVFFAGWIGLRPWPNEMDPRRKHRFSTAVTAASIGLAWLMSFLFAFPQWYAMLWAGTISTTLQLTSAWTPQLTSARTPQLASTWTPQQRSAGGR